MTNARSFRLSRMDPGKLAAKVVMIETMAFLKPINWDQTYGCSFNERGLRRARNMEARISANMEALIAWMASTETGQDTTYVARAIYLEHLAARKRVRDIIEVTEVALTAVQTEIEEECEDERPELPF